MKKETKKRKHLFAGPIPAGKSSEMTAKHQSKTDIGAHAFFLGQVRADNAEGKTVISIIYSAYEEMAEKVLHEIKEEAFVKFNLTCAHIHHSIGEVKTGEISLMVMVSSEHRRAVFASLEWIVEQIKKRVPIWKKEILSDGSVRWIEGEQLAAKA